MALWHGTAVKYQLVSFDFDGTLADSADWFFGVFNQLAEEFRFKPVLAAERELVRDCDSREIMKHLQVPMWKLPKISARMRELSARDRGSIRLFPGIEQVLGRLREAGAQIAIVSSNSEETIRETLGGCAGLVNYFGCGASIFGKASKLKAMLRRTRGTMDDAIYIGDETRDIIAANEVGMAFGAVAWGYASLAALKRHSPAVIFERVDEIFLKLQR